MERLTYRANTPEEDGTFPAYLVRENAEIPCGEKCPAGTGENCEDCWYDEVIERLAEYEDTGVEPRDLKRLASHECWELIKIIMGASEEALRQAVKFIEEAEEWDNPGPLTDKELEEMDGKPVYVVSGGVGRWYICCDTLRMISGAGVFYRREPREVR